MSSTTTTRITCPGICGATTCGEQVDAYGFGDFAATTVRVDPCSKLLAQGWTGPQLVERKSRADYLIPTVQATVLRHRDGLVAFVG